MNALQSPPLTTDDPRSYDLARAKVGPLQTPYTRAEVAALFGKSERTIDRWLTEGRLPRVKIPGGSVMIPRKPIDEMLSSERSVRLGGKAQ